MNAQYNQDITAEELAAAYRRTRLRYRGISLFKMLNTPFLYKALCLQAKAERRGHSTSQSQVAA
jgi:hypothetical protein